MLNSLRFLLISASLFIVLDLVAGQHGRGSGSHQHMQYRKNHDSAAHNHEHYVPKPPDQKNPGQNQPGSVLREKELIHDSQHLREELGESFTDEQIAKMTSEELEFHYFKLHDYDDNNKLDGLEMLNAITHIMPHNPTLDLRKKGEKNLSEGERLALLKAETSRDEQLQHFIGMIDSMLREADQNKDGFLDYAEYAKGTRIKN